MFLKFTHILGKTAGYGNNFGECADRDRKIDSLIIKMILKPMVTLFTENKKDLYEHDNIVSMNNDPTSSMSHDIIM